MTFASIPRRSSPGPFLITRRPQLIAYPYIAGRPILISAPDPPESSGPLNRSPLYGPGRRHRQFQLRGNRGPDKVFLSMLLAHRISVPSSMHAQVFSWYRCELVGGIGRFQCAEVTEENTEIMDSEMEGQNIEIHHESALLKSMRHGLGVSLRSLKRATPCCLRSSVDKTSLNRRNSLRLLSALLRGLHPTCLGMSGCPPELQSYTCYSSYKTVC